jgi:hypothetical protein
MDMLGHSGGTLYKVLLLFLSQSGEAVEVTRVSASVDIEEHCSEKPKRVVSLLPKKKGQASLLPSLAARRACEKRRQQLRQRSAAAHVKASARSAFIIRMYSNLSLHAHLDSAP